ncbi:MAG: hypothetical protein ACHQEM_03360 [Chitinophagales bacterium]
MLVQFNKNIQFTKLVKADGRWREFNFRRVNGLHEATFTIDVSDDRGNRIMIRVQKNEGQWKIEDPQVPFWIREVEQNFHDIIEEELRYS